MKIIIAFDSFKGTLTAIEACSIVSKAIKTKLPDADLVLKPMADGGEGTAQAMIMARNGKWIPRRVMGPLSDMQVDAGFAWFEKEKEALVEMAKASGMELLSKEQLNPYKTTTYGTGQLIKAAIEYGAEKILLAVGGSATVDGGVGAAKALGWKFIDKNGEEIPLGGKYLDKIKKILKPNDITLPLVEVLCDVNNPLCGRNGAARIYGPQKGATPEMVAQLDKGLKSFVEVVKKEFDCDIDVAGAGAAGGLASGAIAFMDATLVSGIDAIVKLIKLEEYLADADWIITGEGKFDHQSLMGKAISGILKIAMKTNTKAAVLAGQVSVSQNDYKKSGIDVVISCKKPEMSLDYAISNCRQLLGLAACQFVQEHIKP